jgi:TolA-binding protein
MRDHQSIFVAGSGAPAFLPKRRETVCRRVLIGAAIACGLAAGEAAAAVTTQPPPARQERDASLAPVKAIVDGMQNAGVRLKQGDTGTGTRTIQEKVVNDLQKLIDEAKSKSRRRQQQQKSESKQNQSSQNRSDSQQKSGSDAAAGAQPASGQPGHKSGKGKPSVSEKRSPGLPQRPLLREVWGHLPPAMRERVPSDFHEAILPAYDDLVRRYFESLLDSTAERGPDTSVSPLGAASGSPGPSAPASELPAQ